jgi:hypothetical protein
MVLSVLAGSDRTSDAEREFVTFLLDAAAAWWFDDPEDVVAWDEVEGLVVRRLEALAPPPPPLPPMSDAELEDLSRRMNFIDWHAWGAEQ